MSKKDDKNKKTSEDVCRELIHATNEEMAMHDCEYVSEYMNHEDYQKILERAAWYLNQEVGSLDTDDAMLLMNQDAESMLEEAIDMNTTETIMLMAELNMSDLIATVAPHELDHNQMREIINFAEELKTYLPKRG